MRIILTKISRKTSFQRLTVILYAAEVCLVDIRKIHCAKKANLIVESVGKKLWRRSHDQNQHHTDTADRHDLAGRWCSGSVSVAQGLQASDLLDGSGSPECDSDILEQEAQP